MNRSHPWLVAAGALVLALTNAVVLVGVALNRRQPPDSVLTLTERELGPQWSWMWREGENSESSLRLRYRVESSANSSSPGSGEEETFSTYGGFGPIAWLDRDKLAALGFDVAQPLTSADTDTHYNRMLGRDVLLVLELDGPVRARALRAARELLARRERNIAANPDRQLGAEQLQNAQRAEQKEEYEASRLFIVDAGLDKTTLRQRYPDRTRYAIVNGNIRPYVVRDGKSARLSGAVTAVRCETINVPRQLMAPARAEDRHPFTLDVAFGSRLEPWIVSGRAVPASSRRS